MAAFRCDPGLICSFLDDHPKKIGEKAQVVHLGERGELRRRRPPHNRTARHRPTERVALCPRCRAAASITLSIFLGITSPGWHFVY